MTSLHEPGRMEQAAEPDFASRSDHVETKLELLRAAVGRGRYDLALALADSVKDGISAERQMRSDPGIPVIPATAAGDVGSLPHSWAGWARGWSTYQLLVLEEKDGLGRRREPIDLLVSVPADRTGRFAREARLAHVDQETGALREIPCQVYNEMHRGGERFGRVVFLASLPAHGRELYVLFTGNRDAEIPDYLTDLRVRGEGFGLDVENAHFIATLSGQMGQLERLKYKQDHGLELYAGGNGHGEPPNIDWAHDYVSAGRLQKFRVTNWAMCPNYEVVRGPLAVSLRRWGFPHGPIHPLFTPSRLFMDLTYTFYAHTPYFLKQGRMEATRDFTLNYMRDDEWLFTGSPFTDMVWMDANGRLHEGEVPPEQQDDLWAVGFYHSGTGASFISLRLEHSAEGFTDALHHGGPPLMDYMNGGNQIWSRWAVRDEPFFPGGSVLTQRNAYLMTPYHPDSGAETAERYWQCLQHPLQAMAVDPLSVPESARSLGQCAGRLARPGEAGDGVISKEGIWRALAECQDGQLHLIDSNVVDMGYVYDVRVRANAVSVLMTMPHRGRPKYDWLAEPIRQRLLRLPGVEQVVVDLTWNPPWSFDDLSDKARESLGLTERRETQTNMGE